MQKLLQNKKIAILAAGGVNERHMTEIQKGLMKAGAFMRVISVDTALINSWNGSGWGVNFTVDVNLNTALGVDYDMLIIPGGARSIERFSRTAHTKRFISSLARLHRPIGVIEDGAELLKIAEVDKNAENIIHIDENEMAVLVTHFAENSSEQLLEAA